MKAEGQPDPQRPDPTVWSSTKLAGEWSAPQVGGFCACEVRPGQDAMSMHAARQWLLQVSMSMPCAYRLCPNWMVSDWRIWLASSLRANWIAWSRCVSAQRARQASTPCLYLNLNIFTKRCSLVCACIAHIGLHIGEERKLLLLLLLLIYY